jgi:hypothetical protein
MRTIQQCHSICQNHSACKHVPKLFNKTKQNKTSFLPLPSLPAGYTGQQQERSNKNNDIVPFFSTIN